MNDNNFGLSFIEGLTGEYIPEDKLVNNKAYYNKKYSFISKAYGFGSFSSMYEYCKDDAKTLDLVSKSANEPVNQGDINEEGKKSKRKDTSDLILVTKPTIRNGKPYVAPYWVDPNKATPEELAHAVQGNEQAPIQDGLYTGGTNFGEPLSTTTNNSKPPKSWFTLGKYKKPCFDYIYIISNTQLSFIAGINNVDNMLTVQYASALDNKRLAANTHKLLSKLVKEAWQNNLGVMFDTDMFIKCVNITPFCELYNLKSKGNVYYAKTEDLQNTLGDFSCFLHG